jgi:hypothetical protein
MPLTPAQLKTLRRTPVGPGGNRVATAITLADTNQCAVARAINRSNTYVWGVTSGRYGTIKMPNAHLFAAHFGCTVDDLFPAPTEVAAVAS